jgi:hypothetical protein
MQSANQIVWVENFDEEDWKQLLQDDDLEEREDGKDFLRVN